MEKEKINIMAVQMKSVIAYKDANFKKIEKLISDNIRPDVDILVLPELWNVGWACNKFIDSAESLDNSPTIELLKSLAIKYNGNISAGRYFGKMLGRRLARSELYKDVDMVIPVPLHWTRRWKRGYNQAEVLASGVAEIFKIPLKADILKRRRRTQTQTKMSIENKSRNVSGAFSISDEYIPQRDIRHILLIDDVFTTGSTLMACFTALRSVFPPGVRISVATLGFVGGG